MREAIGFAIFGFRRFKRIKTKLTTGSTDRRQNYSLFHHQIQMLYKKVNHNHLIV